MTTNATTPNTPQAAVKSKSIAVFGAGPGLGQAVAHGAAIEQSAFYTEMERAKAAGEPFWEMRTVAPAHLADLLGSMHGTKKQAEAFYPENLFDR